MKSIQCSTNHLHNANSNDFMLNQEIRFALLNKANKFSTFSLVEVMNYCFILFQNASKFSY